MDKFVAEILHMAGHGNCDESCDSYWNAWAIDFVNRIRADAFKDHGRCVEAWPGLDYIPIKGGEQE